MPRTTVNISLPPEDKQMFQRVYPNCLTKFVLKAIKLALNNRTFFETVFFSEV